MKFWMATLVWVLGGGILGLGIYRLVHGKPVMFIAALIGFLGISAYFYATGSSGPAHSSSDHH